MNIEKGLTIAYEATNCLVLCLRTREEQLSKKLKSPDNDIELYQYRRCNVFSFNDFLKNQLTLVHPKHFNDIFEGMPYFNSREFVNI